MMNKREFVAGMVALPAGLCLVFQAAGALEAPKGEVILTVKGNVGNANDNGVAKFDREMLLSIDGRRATVSTPWEEGMITFSGPKLRNVLEQAGAKGSRIIVRALNDYAVEIPFDDAIKYDTILAMQKNGMDMSVRDKGPLFLIYPFDTNPELYTEKYFSRSVWQISEMEVVD